MQLLDLIATDHAFDHPSAEIEPLQLVAADALFQDLRKKIPVLDRRAKDTGIDRITSMEDIVPLLFAHTVYKSYPESFVEKGRWDRMLAWLTTLAADDWTGVDLTGVENVDDWIAVLRAAGCMVLATSGTSGKCSFLPASTEDKRLKLRHFKHTQGWPRVVGDNQYRVFAIGPSEGPNSAIEALQISRDTFAMPGEFYALTDEPLRMVDVAEGAAFTKKMREGKALPSEIESFQHKVAESSERMEERFHALADLILQHRHEPCIINGMWAQQLKIIARARELGIPDGDFHPGTIIGAGGGIKGVPLPADYKEQVQQFYGDVHHKGVFGMTETNQPAPRCEAMRYHRPPGLIWLLLDQTGEKLLNAKEGVVQGRYAFLDLMFTGRWGGVITGDKVEVDWSKSCPCGRPGPTIIDTITRYMHSGEDDHIGCAGTIDGYVRGVLTS